MAEAQVEDVTELLEGSSLGQKMQEQTRSPFSPEKNELWSENFGWLRKKQKRRKRWMQRGERWGEKKAALKNQIV